MYPTRTTCCNRLISSGDQFRGHHAQFLELGMVSPELYGGKLARPQPRVKS